MAAGARSPPEGDPRRPGRDASPSLGAFVDAAVHVMDAPGHVEEAILWDAGAVLAVGPEARIAGLARARGIEPVALGGRVVIPGFVDAHTHFLHVGLKRTRPDLRRCRSLEEALERAAAWLRLHPGAAPVIADGWDESEWREAVRPHRRDLDAVLEGVGQAGRPLVFRRIDGHTAVAGTAALPPLAARWPGGGLVDAATGVLLEDASLYLNEVFPASEAQLDEALAHAQDEAHRLGVTAVGDYEQAPYRAAVRRAAQAGRLAVRVFSSIYPQQLAEEVRLGFSTGRRWAGAAPPAPPAFAGPPPASPDVDWVRDGGLKVFLDGSLGAHTAHLREPYLDGPPPGAPCTHPHPRGTPIWSDGELDRILAQAHAAGVQVHAHAIGDAAIDQGLAAFARLAAHEGLEGRGWLEAGPLPSGEGARRGPQPPGDRVERADGKTTDLPPGAATALRHRFEHYEIVHDEQLARTVRLGLVASSQPNFVGAWSAKGGMYQERLGARYALNNRFRSFKEAGLRLAFGSDGMPFSPLVGIAAAVRHPVAGERLTGAEAVWHYTREAAWAIHWEDAIGTLQAGRHADLVVLDAKELAGDPTSWQITQAYTAGRPHLASHAPATKP